MDLRYETKPPIAFFTMDRVEKFNAITPDMMSEMEDALMRFMEALELRVGIITGAGTKAFSSGADIDLWLPFVKSTADRPWRIPRTPMRGLKVTKPLIAAVNGLAYGGGAEIAIACDLRVASETAAFKWPEPALGIIPRLGGTQRLPRLIGKAKAMEILLCGEKVDAHTALQIGLVNKVVSSEQLMKTAVEMAMKISKMAPLAVTSIKRCLDEGTETDLNSGLAIENELGLKLYETEDYEEGRCAFREKRCPEFKGR
jgi:enoyl-CoA hydratase/carnithine racemase